MKKLFIGIAFALLFAPAAFAQYAGPGPGPVPGPVIGTTTGTAYDGGLGAAAAVLAGGAAQKANNLSDLGNATTARTNLGLGTAATAATGTSGATLGLLNANKTDSGNNTYSGVDTMSGTMTFTGTGSALIVNNNVNFKGITNLTGTTTNVGQTTVAGAQGVTINTETGANGYLSFAKPGGQRWRMTTDTAAETGTPVNTGSDLLIGSYNDSGANFQTLLSGYRASGPTGLGAPYFAAFGVYTQNTPKADGPASGAYGNTENLNTGSSSSDIQPTVTLGSNPITTTSGSGIVTINWPNCCGTGNVIDSTLATLVNFAGVVSTNGITLSGFYQVHSIADSNDFTVQTGTPASASGPDGGSAVTVTPSYGLSGNIFSSVVNASTTESGYIVQNTDYYYVNPSYFSTAIPSHQYQRSYTQFYTPPETSGNYGYGDVDTENDYINRSIDLGYVYNPFTSAQPAIGYWIGPITIQRALPAAAGTGTAHNWETDMGFKTQYGAVGSYQAIDITPDFLVGAANDPTGHGGVGLDVDGSIEQLPALPFSVTSGSSVVTVAVTSGHLIAQLSGGTVYVPKTYTVRGVTLAPGVYTMSNVTTTSFQITGSGSATSTGTGGDAAYVDYVYFENLVPYADHQISGEWLHGIITTEFRSDDGLLIHTQPGNGMGWDDGTGVASINGVEVSLGNINIVMTPTGTGAIVNAGHVASTGTSPTTSNGTLNASATDTKGTVTEGTSITSVTITWHSAYATAPDCIVTSPTGSVATSYTPSTTTLVINNASATGDKFTYYCTQ